MIGRFFRFSNCGLNNGIGDLSHSANGLESGNPVTLNLSTSCALLVIRRSNTSNGGTQVYIITNNTRPTVLKLASDGAENVSVVNNGNGSITLTSNGYYWNYHFLEM